MRRPRFVLTGIDEPLTPRALELWEDWLQHARLRDLLRTLERRTWQPWCMRTGYLGERYRVRPEMREAIRKQLALLIHQEGGRYNDGGGCIIRSDGTRIWTELL